jgi:hypothetical protein
MNNKPQTINNELQSIKITKLCETNPISKKPKMKLTFYLTKDYENKSGLLTMEKQTQSNPILSTVAVLSTIALAKADSKGKTLRNKIADAVFQHRRLSSKPFCVFCAFLWLNPFNPWLTKPRILCITNNMINPKDVASALAVFSQGLPAENQVLWAI